MDFLADFMNPNTPFRKIKVPVGQVNGARKVEPEQDQHAEFFQSQSAGCSSDYAEKYQKEEEALYIQASKSQEEDPVISMLDNVSDLLSSVGQYEIDVIKKEQSLKIFNQYNFDKQRSQRLIIDEFRDKILVAINVHSTVIIDGPTGCGKTTQVSQFILDDCRANGQPCKIIVTQPRRIAAITVARRVCEERNWPIGTVCGYQVGLQTNLCNETILQYVTTGVLLQKLITQKNLHEYTHIVVDEVHERNQEMDFLLLLIRRLLNTNSINTKVILMSATFKSEEFSEYFKSYCGNQFITAPIISVNKPSRYNTQVFYIDKLSGLGKVPNFNLDEPKIESCMYSIFEKLIRAFNTLDHEDPITKEKTIGNILVFLPGILEIEEANDRLVEYSKKMEAGGKMYTGWYILPLHSSITTEEQRKIFQPPPPGKRKIILSTNIAESSITVPDIVYVVDFCLTKILKVDQETQYQSLQLEWASHVNCIQRSGRVGRVADGRIYRLVPEKFYERLSTTVQPEILRAPLNQVVLKAKLLELNQPPKAILALAMNPPNLSNIDSSVLYLKEIGALSRKCNGHVLANDGDITFLGKIMAALPLDVHLSKLIILGHMFSCLNECIIIATGCSLNIFKTPFKERLKAYIKRLQWADGSASDLIAYLNIYQVWQKKHSSRDVRVEQEWCKQNYVSQRSLREWSVLIREIQDRLERMQIEQTVGRGQVVLSNSEKTVVIMVVICGAFYPYYFKRTSDSVMDEKEAVKTLGGHDPFDTVYFTGFDNQQPGKIYAKSFKNQLRDCATHMEVTFESGSNKVYVQFLDAGNRDYVKVDGKDLAIVMPGKIKINVYRAVKMRQLGMAINVAVMDKVQAWKWATEDPVEQSSNNEEEFPISHTTVLPPLDVQCIHIHVSLTVKCGHFWAQYVDGETARNLITFDKVLNQDFRLESADSANLNENNIYAAVFKEDGCYYRCKIIQREGRSLRIIFIDYGNEETVGLNDLYELPKHKYMPKPGQAMECILSEIQPSFIANPRTLWTVHANQRFNTLTRDKRFYAKIYSVVQGIVHLELYKEDCTIYTFENSLNNLLINEGFAVPTEESYLSRENHQRRLDLCRNPDRVDNSLKMEEIIEKPTPDVELPPAHLCTSMIKLRGPFSPFEMHIYSAIASGASKHIKIDGDSVNAVLLDAYPQDPHDRLIVAAHIGQNASGSTLSLRHTTLMPNIHGFPMLVSSLFCPVMETKPTEDGSRFAAVLCGLGSYEGEHRSLYPPHDICLTLDTNLTNDDLDKINAMRHWMNVTVETMDCNNKEASGQVNIEECQVRLKNALFDLLKQKRNSVPKIHVKYATIWGKCLFDSELLKADESHVGIEIWPLHSTMKLNKQAAATSSINQ